MKKIILIAVFAAMITGQTANARQLPAITTGLGIGTAVAGGMGAWGFYLKDKDLTAKIEKLQSVAKSPEQTQNLELLKQKRLWVRVALGISIAVVLGGTATGIYGATERYQYNKETGFIDKVFAKLKKQARKEDGEGFNEERFDERADEERLGLLNDLKIAFNFVGLPAEQANQKAHDRYDRFFEAETPPDHTVVDGGFVGSRSYPHHSTTSGNREEDDFWG